MTTATELWQARQISSIRKDQIMRNELDLARAEVAKMAAEIAELTAERDHLSSEIAVFVGIVTQLDIENQRLNRDNDELRRMCEIVERIQGERDRARDLAVRAGAFANDLASLAIAQLQEDVDTLSSELEIMERERDQSLYERDQARESVEFSRGVDPDEDAMMVPDDGR